MDIEENIEVADNVVDNEQPTSPVETPVDQTKAFATRLKEATAKAREEERENIAKSFGYDSWNEYVDTQTNNKLLDKGIDPDTVRPMVKDLIKNDPEYIEAMKYKAEKEELEKKLFASNSIQALNNTFGTNYKSIDELDAETVKMWNDGTPLEKAFAANNWSKLNELAVKKATTNTDNGKSHLKVIDGSLENTKTREYSKDELSMFNVFGYSKDDVANWKKSHENK